MESVEPSYLMCITNPPPIHDAANTSYMIHHYLKFGDIDSISINLYNIIVIEV